MFFLKSSGIMLLLRYTMLSDFLDLSKQFIVVIIKIKINILVLQFNIINLA